MSEKVELKEKILAVDQNIRDLWDAMDADQQKALKQEFFILNRYISNIEGGSTDEQAHFVLTVNEYFNKHWSSLQKHPKLMWMLLCMCSYDGKKKYFHKWMGKKKEERSNKKAKLLAEFYPNKKDDEIDLLADLMTDAEIKELARSHGLDEQTIAKKLK